MTLCLNKIDIHAKIVGESIANKEGMNIQKCIEHKS